MPLLVLVGSPATFTAMGCPARVNVTRWMTTSVGAGVGEGVGVVALVAVAVGVFVGVGVFVAVGVSDAVGVAVGPLLTTDTLSKTPVARVVVLLPVTGIPM